jgi:hypothetical protein
MGTALFYTIFFILNTVPVGTTFLKKISLHTILNVKVATVRSLYVILCMKEDHKQIQTPWPLVRKRTIPTERPLLLTKFSANFCG